MAEHGVLCSLSRSGNVWDNAAMESFFSSLKTERTARKVYRSRDQARADVFDYIERFYNPLGPHSPHLGGALRVMLAQVVAHQGGAGRKRLIERFFDSDAPPFRWCTSVARQVYPAGSRATANRSVGPAIGHGVQTSAAAGSEVVQPIVAARASVPLVWPSSLLDKSCIAFARPVRHLALPLAVGLGRSPGSTRDPHVSGPATRLPCTGRFRPRSTSRGDTFLVRGGPIRRGMDRALSHE